MHFQRDNGKVFVAFIGEFFTLLFTSATLWAILLRNAPFEIIASANDKPLTY